jgi:membrane-bound lytic murein transglycosylase D
MLTLCFVAMVESGSLRWFFVLTIALGLSACASTTPHHAQQNVPGDVQSSFNLPDNKTDPVLQDSATQETTESKAGEESPPETEWSLIVPGSTPVGVNLENEPEIQSRPPLVVTEGLKPAEISRLKAEAKRVYWKHWPVSSKRSTYYRQRILDVFDEMNAPPELQVIPIVESGYNPYAISPTGAMGLWQLMPGTARHLGVSRDTSLDGRRHVEESTRAALKYLLYLKKKFTYWPLAIAAYHVGPGHMERRLRRRPWRPELGLNRLPAPRITRAYVRHVLGLAALYHEDVLKFPDFMRTEALTIQGPVDLTELERASGLDKTSLFILNPGLEQSQYLAGPITFHAPADRLTLIQSNIPQAKPRSFYITVKKGDTLWKLARQHRTTVAALRHLNPDLGKVLHIGQRLKVQTMATGKLKYATASNPLLTSRRVVRYKVRRGDSVWSIAQRFGTSPRAIIKSNQLGRKHLIRPGQRLLIPASGRYARKASSSKNKRIRYVVRNGDSLWRIARKFGTSVSAIARTNKLGKDHTLRPGDKLWILASARSY